VVLHDRTSGDNDSFGGSDVGSGEIRRVEVIEPGRNFLGRGVSKKEADLAFDMLPMAVNTHVGYD
jgi:hypothetical protein